MSFPDFFVLGAAKAGTSALAYYLSEHPEICMAHPKEPTFFFGPDYHSGLPFYKRTYFRHYNGELLTGEAAHRNLYFPYVPRRIADSTPEAKFLVMLRNPVDRAISHYQYVRARREESRDFRSAIQANLDRLKFGPFLLTEEEGAEYTRKKWDADYEYPTYLDTGHYAEQIQRYFDFFGKERVKIVMSEDLLGCPDRTMADVYHFLGASPFSVQSPETVNPLAMPAVYKIYKGVGALPLVNKMPGSWRNMAKLWLAKTFQGRKSPVSKEDREFLQNYYEPHNKRLECLLERDLGHWNWLAQRGRES